MSDVFDKAVAASRRKSEHSYSVEIAKYLLRHMVLENEPDTKELFRSKNPTSRLLELSGAPIFLLPSQRPRLSVESLGSLASGGWRRSKLLDEYLEMLNISPDDVASSALIFPVTGYSRFVVAHSHDDWLLDFVRKYPMIILPSDPRLIIEHLDDYLKRFSLLREQKG